MGGAPRIAENSLQLSHIQRRGDPIAPPVFAAIGETPFAHQSFPHSRRLALSFGASPHAPRMEDRLHHGRRECIPEGAVHDFGPYHIEVVFRSRSRALEPVFPPPVPVVRLAEEWLDVRGKFAPERLFAEFSRRFEQEAEAIDFGQSREGLRPCPPPSRKKKEGHQHPPGHIDRGLQPLVPLSPLRHACERHKRGRAYSRVCLSCGRYRPLNGDRLQDMQKKPLPLERVKGAYSMNST